MKTRSLFLAFFLIFLPLHAGAADPAPVKKRATAAASEERPKSGNRRNAQTAAQTSAQPEQQVAGTPQQSVQSAIINFKELAESDAFAPITPPIMRFVPAPKKVEQEEGMRPVPEGALIFREETAATAAPEQLVPSPAAAASFPGSSATGWLPPDTQGAAGPNHLMVAVNGGVLIQSKSGATVGAVRSLVNFFALVANGSNDVFDPRLQYDPYGGRWILVAAADRSSAASAILVAVSQSSDPTGNWFLYRLDADPQNLSWADYPVIGFNKDWIVVSANMFPLQGSGAQFYSRLYVLNKANYYAGATGNYTQISAPGGVSGTIAPASTYDPTLSTMYLLKNWNGNSNGSGFLRLFTVTGPVGSEVMNHVSTGIFISTPSTWAFSPTNFVDFAPQFGTLDKVHVNDADIQNVVYRNGSLWCAHTVFLPAGGPTRSSVQWWQINAATNAVQQRGRVDDPTGAAFYGFPSIAVNRNNDALIGFSRFSAAHYPGAGYVYRAGADAANTTRDDTALKAGEGPYSRPLSSKNRWGDYSATVVDPSNDTDMWTLQEYAVIGNNWGTWWGRIGGGLTCSFSISPTAQSFAAGGGTGSVAVTAPAGCAWTAASNNSFLTVTGGSSGSGSGTVSYSVAANSTAAQRTGTLTIAGQTFTVTQANSAGPTVQFSPASYTVSEAARKVQLTVMRTGDASAAASVKYATADGTADRRKDYTQLLGTLNFAANETSKTITVFITDDVFPEPAESFTVALSEPSGTGLGAATATVTINSDDSVLGLNPVDANSFSPNFYVRQHYVDFLNREADPGGLLFWTNNFPECGGNQQCLELRRVNVSAAFFLSIEFQETGYLVYRMYKAAFGDATSPGVPGTVPVIRLEEFLPDTQRIGQGVEVGVGNWSAQLEANKNAYALEFAQRQRFLSAFPAGMTPTQFVDKLNANAGNVLSAAERTQLINELTASNTTQGRAAVFRKVAEDDDLRNSEFRRAFVLMQYYGYLRRNPDDPQDTNFGGWKFWLDKLNQNDGDFVRAEMVKAFITSIEYKNRFGQ